MHAEPLVHALLHYRYWILTPLAILEGPVVALIAGTLAARGYFSLSWLFGLFLLKDLLVDVVYYGLGRFGANRPKVKRLLMRARVTSAQQEHVRQLWVRHGWPAMFAAKLSFGLAPVFLVVAGLVALPVALFVRYALGVAVVQYTVLLGVGFAMGASPGVTSPALRVAQLTGIGITVIAIVWMHRYLRGVRTPMPAVIFPGPESDSLRHENVQPAGE